jgi:hypothetical protein
MIACTCAKAVALDFDVVPDMGTFSPFRGVEPWLRRWSAAGGAPFFAPLNGQSFAERRFRARVRKSTSRVRFLFAYENERLTDAFESLSHARERVSRRAESLSRTCESLSGGSESLSLVC